RRHLRRAAALPREVSREQEQASGAGTPEGGDRLRGGRGGGIGEILARVSRPSPPIGSARRGRAEARGGTSLAGSGPPRYAGGLGNVPGELAGKPSPRRGAETSRAGETQGSGSPRAREGEGVRGGLSRIPRGVSALSLGDRRQKPARGAGRVR